MYVCVRARARVCVCIYIYIPYFPAHKTHRDFFVRNFRKNNYECILILVNYWKEQEKCLTLQEHDDDDDDVNYWKKTGLLHTKISHHNTMMPDIMIWKQISLSHDKDV
jgi:hypothetical protein